MEEIDFERRFGGVKRLHGSQGLAKLRAARVCIVGIGGVGSWAAEALARNAVGHITLIDLDNIAESNFNRQLHATHENIGKTKVSAMRKRILEINPICEVQEIEDFISTANIETLLHAPFDGIIDCTDDTKAKISLALYCQEKQIAFIMSGSAGGRIDPTRIQNADIANVNGDKLLAKVRHQLRKHHAYPSGSSLHTNNKKSKKMGITCVYSNEIVKKPIAENCELITLSGGLNCAGYGSCISVTATFGFISARMMLNQLLY